tara:strand:+ start:5811 stop:6077 length:267 start_codon:yes stop_codon:yes gene_type:complete
MAITSGQITVGTSAVQIDGCSNNPSRLHIHNNDNTNDLFLGDQTVTISNGLRLPKLDSIELVLNPAESLYAISAGGSHAVSWLRQTMN